MDTSEKYLKMCKSAKKIQRKWSYENGDYIFDPFDGEARAWFWYNSKDVGDYIWLPRLDQLQELCIDFFMQNLGISRREAVLRFLEWYSNYLRQTFENGFKNSEYSFVDSARNYC